MKINGNKTGKLGLVLLVVMPALVGGCRIPTRVVRTEARPTVQQKQYRIPGPKRRVAIASFTDKTGYGNNLFGRVDDIGTQAADILASHLVKSGQFIVLERERLGHLLDEQRLQGLKEEEAIAGLIGVDALVFGAVTEFGTRTTGTERLFSKRRVQAAHCKVTIRLVDPRTGHVFYSEFGAAEAQLAVDEVFGFGGRASYDTSLTDKALNGAIVKLLGNIINRMGNRPWTGSILDIQEHSVFVNAGERIGLRVGDVLSVVRPGKFVRNPQTNARIQLPGREVARIRVVSQFGNNELDEGSVCEIVSGGDIAKTDMVKLQDQKEI